MLTGFAAELDCAFVLCFMWCVCVPSDSAEDLRWMYQGVGVQG